MESALYCPAPHPNLVIAIQDPTVHGNAEAETLLHAFVTLQERVEALRRFVLINRASLTKILKKYLRRLGSGANATNNFNETPEERPVAKNPEARDIDRKRCLR